MNQAAIQRNNLHRQYTTKVLAGANLNALCDDERFHMERRLGIGGSDVAAILGISPYRTAYDVWLEKTGRKTPDDLSCNPHVHFGTELEDIVAKEYARRTGQKIQKRRYPYVHKSMPWLRANIDRFIIGADKGLECKTADKWAARDQWGKGNIYQELDNQITLFQADDDVPEPYMLQELHYMIVLNKREWDLAVLIGGNDFRIFTMAWNQALADIVTQRLTTYWFDHVIADVPPEPQTLQDVECLYRYDDGSHITATPDIIDVFWQFKTLKEQISALETQAYGPLVGGKRIGGLDMKIKAFMGEHADLLLDETGKKLCSWKTQRAQRMDTTAFKKANPALAAQFTTTTESRVFRA
ncbi:YqaJ viral recombinase family protein [Parasalinivibrio latis]|uniref:YqaJ viral recombinase family nuclease n=1 Tax=Parasalinivibrio latis TaxID=2952610 RepID=UPI0030E3F554